MTEQCCILQDHLSCDQISAVQEEYRSLILSSAEHKATNPALSSLESSFPPIIESLVDSYPNKRRQILNHSSTRLSESGLSGNDLAIKYLQAKYSKNLTAGTILQAGYVLLSFLAFLNSNNIDFRDITRKNIGSFVEHEQDRGLKINSLRSHLRTVYAFINFLVEEQIVAPSILHKKIRLRLPDVLPRAIPVEDIEAILSIIDNVRDRALIQLLLRTGMRIGELLNVKVADIILPEKKILIYLGEKNFRGRVAYFNDDAGRALQEWLKIRNCQKEYLFYSPSRENLSYAAARKIMNKRLEQAGVSNKGYSLHSLRHTFATDMLNAGLHLEVLQQLLGHQSIDITLRYARMSDTTKKSAYFKAMATIEQGEQYESYRVNSQLQAVFEEKKLLTSHNKKLPA
ncbi:MAG: tyrosine-type recombinase/integrase [Proteobacteria bacterium]|nr:tyrosine-type recombinase/integrase [Pseudomonadota bacterium]